MEAMYQAYREIAEIRLIYIREAHAADGKWPVDYAKRLGINEHRTFGERCATAKSFLDDHTLTIPCLIDTIEDQVNDAYSAWPDRIYIVRTDGRLALVARPGPAGFAPGLSAARQWLEELSKTGLEPALPDGAAEAGESRHVTARND